MLSTYWSFLKYQGPWWVLLTDVLFNSNHSPASLQRLRGLDTPDLRFGTHMWKSQNPMAGDWLGLSCLDLRTIPKGHPSSRTPCRNWLRPLQVNSSLCSVLFISLLCRWIYGDHWATNHPYSTLRICVQGIPSNKQFSSLQFLHLKYVVNSSICIIGLGRLGRLMYYIKFYTTPGIL